MWDNGSITVDDSGACYVSTATEDERYGGVHCVPQPSLIVDRVVVGIAHFGATGLQTRVGPTSHARNS